MKKGLRYVSYLLRLWLAEDRDQPLWRASLENTHTGERMGFASLEALMAYLNSPAGLTNRPNHNTRKGEKS
jgi:hypothetical protein